MVYRRTILLLILYLTLVVYSFGQKANIGFKIGTLFSDNYGTDAVSKAKFKPGITGGVFLCHHLSGNIYLQYGLNYENKGYQIKLEGIQVLKTFGVLTGTYRTRFNHNYITFPVIAKYHFSKGKTNYIGFGSYCSILINAIQDGVSNYPESSSFPTSLCDGMDSCYDPYGFIRPVKDGDYYYLVERDITGLLKKGDFGFSIELGSLKQINDNLMLLYNAQFSFGLVNIDKKYDRSIRNNSFTLTIGFGF